MLIFYKNTLLTQSLAYELEYFFAPAADVVHMQPFGKCGKRLRLLYRLLHEKLYVVTRRNVEVARQLAIYLVLYDDIYACAAVIDNSRKLALDLFGVVIYDDSSYIRKTGPVTHHVTPARSSDFVSLRSEQRNVANYNLTANDYEIGRASCRERV